MATTSCAEAATQSVPAADGADIQRSFDLDDSKYGGQGPGKGLSKVPVYVHVRMLPDVTITSSQSKDEKVQDIYEIQYILVYAYNGATLAACCMLHAAHARLPIIMC